MKRTAQKSLSLIVLFIIMISCMVCITYADENDNTINKISFIDGGVEDYNTLFNIISKKMPVYIIENDRDGIVQITNILSNYNNLDGINIYSKGKSGEIKLGTSFLNIQSVDKYEAYIESWNDRLNPTADISIYSCNVAKSDEGKQLINQIADITGADVAASINYTGTYGINTDWELEYCAGSIEANKIHNSKEMYEYKARLDGTTRTWDGEGEDNNWNTAKNWTGDVVPDAYDIVVFDSTSTKNVYGGNNVTVYDFIIKEGYTGETSGNNVTVNNDFQMNGGSVDIYKLEIKGTTSITAGESLKGRYLYTYGDVSITNVENPIEMQMHICKGEGDTTIDGDFEAVNISFDEADHDYRINGNITISGNRGQYCSPGFTNNGNITINDGAKIDVSKCNYNYYNYRYDYHNYGTITENGTGKFYADAKDLYFCNSNGDPIIESSVGENIFISLTDFDGNLDKDQKETVTVTVKRESDLNDTVTLTLTETENNSSLFRNLSGLELVAADVVPGAGQLKYNGTENLIAEYVDSNSAEDTMSCKMDRDPIIWDGEGEYNYWYTAENWSTDSVPKMYDIVLFNSTSIKDVLQSQECEISKIVVDDGYTGEIKFDRSYSQSNFNTKIYNDIIVKDGAITLNTNLTVNGDVDIQGGVLKNLPYSTNKSVINGDLNISGGEFKFLGYYLDLEGNLNVSNGSFIIRKDEWSHSEVDFYGNEDMSGGTIDIKKAVIKSVGNTISVNNIAGKIIDELIIEESTEFNGNIGVGALTLNENKILDINGTLTCNDSFTNKGTINVADGATLDIKSVTTYENNIIDDNSTGKILYDASGMDFVSGEGVSIGTANIGDKIYVELVDLSKNKSIYEKETVLVTVSSQETGDTEVILLTETGNDTSVFRAETGIELIDTETEPVVGQLKYNGTEDLEAVYIDDRDEKDTISCNLYKESIIWDGEGKDNNWTTAENWSTDTIPTRYDGIKLNGTSTKNISFNTNIEMYELLVEESYTGEITGKENVSFYAASDVTTEGGTMNISGRFQTGGNLIVNGGSISLSYDKVSEHNIVGGNLLVSDGEILFTKGYFDIEGNISVVGGGLKVSDNWWEQAYFYTYGDVMLEAETDIYNMNINGSNLTCSTEKENLFTTLEINTDGNVDITGKIKTTSFNNNYAAKTTLSGEGTIITLDGGSFNNSNVLNINNGAIFNASNYNYTNTCNSFYNRGQINESEGGKFYCDTKDMYFTNADEDRIVFSDVGDAVFVKLVDGNLNKNGEIKEQVTVTVESVTTGDSEDITLTETEDYSGKYSGIFTNTSGLLLIADDLEPTAGQLKYNGTEDLQTTYTDSTDPEDIYTCNLLREPLVWDGGGDNNYWHTPENWSEDRVPDEYDRIVFNNTSSKNAEQGWNVENIFSITIEASYQGVVKTERSLNVSENVIVNGGKLEISDGKVTAKGNLHLDGGMIEDNNYNEDVFNDVIISGGELKPYNLRVKNNLKITGGKFIDGHWGKLIIEGDTILTNVEEFKSYRLYIYGNNVDILGNKFSAQNLYICTEGEVNLNGNINIVDCGYVDIGNNSTLNLNGKIEFCEENSGGLENKGTLNLNDNSVLDLRKASKFENSGTITIADTAKLYYNAQAMGVTDTSGAPALDDFNFGDDLIVSLIDKNRNLDNSAVENTDVTLKNWTNGDEETYSLTETGNDTGEFRGSGFATALSDTAANGNNTFEGQDRDAFQIIFTDTMSDRVEYVVSKNCAELDIEGIDDLIVEGIDYGNGDINGDASIYTITLQNRGDIPLGIEEISLDNTDDFSLSDDLDTSDILPDLTRDINIDFTPTSCGEKTANLTIKTSDNDEGAITIPLKGTGVELPVCSGIEDITVLQGTETYDINIFEIFEDAQDSDEDLKYEIISNSNSSLVIGTTIDKDNGTLTLNFNTSQCGNSYITLRATDTSNAYVDEDFNVTVSQSYTISGTVVDPDGNPIEGATVKVMDFWDDEKCYTGTTSVDGTFSVSFSSNEISSWRKIKISKAPYFENITESYNWGDEHLGTITLTVEADEQKAQRLANELAEECLGLQNEDCIGSVSNDLLLADTAGEESTIEWSSSNPDVISNSGEVTRPDHGNGDVEVRMTATVHVNDQIAQHEFIIMVRANEANNVPSVAEELTVTVAPGTANGSTQATVADAVGTKLVVNITDTSVDTPNVGDAVPDLEDNLIDGYTSGDDITKGVAADKWLQVYDVDGNGKVVKFYQKQLIAEDVAVAALTNWADVAGDAASLVDYSISGDTYTIKTAKGLAWVAKQVNSGSNDFSDKTVVIDCDVDLADYFWTPIGAKGKPFKGTFDGQGYKITGLKIGEDGSPNDTLEYVGLFGYVDGTTIQDVGVEECAMYSSVNIAYVGGLVGHLYESTITNCYVTGNVTSGDQSVVGGLAGLVNARLFRNARIMNCYVDGNVTGGDQSGAGGLAGLLSIATITNCYADGNVTGGDQSIVGGLAGALNIAVITNSYTVEAVEGGSDAYVGGVVGGNDQGEITYGYWNSDAKQTVGATERVDKKGVGNDGGEAGTTGMVSTDMKKDVFAQTLNENQNDIEVPDGVTLAEWGRYDAKNSGYPVLINVGEGVSKLLKLELNEDYDSLAIMYALGDHEEYVTRNLYLASTGSSGNTNITWTSSDTTITNTGRVTRPAENGEDVNVTLAATITHNVSGEQKTKIFTVKLIKMTAEDAVRDAARHLSITDAFKFASGDTWECVTKQFILLDQGLYDASINWISSNSDIIQIASENGETIGIVNGPENTNANVILTAEISLGDEKITKTFLLIVENQSVIKNKVREKTREVGVQVGQEGTGNIENIDILRTELNNGTRIDTVILDENSLENLTDHINPEEPDESQRTVTVEIPQPETEKADELAVEISAVSLSAMADKNAGLDIKTDEGSVSIAHEELQDVAETGTDLFFRIVPVKNQAEQDEVKNNMTTNFTVVQAAAGAPVNALSIPRKIETNYTGSNASVVLPLTGINIPNEDRQAFLDAISIFIEHSDGTTQLLKGTFLYENGEPSAIKFIINKFSRFQLLSFYEPSTGSHGSHHRRSDSSKDLNTGTGVTIYVNGKAETAGIATTGMEEGQSVTKISVDPQKLEKKLEDEGQYTVVTIPFNNKSDRAIGVLNGQMVKDMANKQAVLEVKTENAVYTLPAEQINFDAISKQLGKNVALEDIEVQVKICTSKAETLKNVENAAKKGEWTISVPPVDFTVKCSANNKTVEVMGYSAYVERIIAIPQGVDSSRITTGVVVEPDGNVRHVPTKIAVIDGKYYAKINSLTNSTYVLVYHPLEFKDVEQHWAKEAVNDMGSRMVVEGVGNEIFDPDRDITRAEFAAIVVRALGLKPGIGTHPFVDVEETCWYSDYIKTAHAYHIISGYGNGYFGPLDQITREQVMTMIARAMNMTGLEVDLQDGDTAKLLAGFNDMDQASEYAKKSIAACIHTGVVLGRNENHIVPKGNITRAEVAVIIRRLLQKSALI